MTLLCSSRGGRRFSGDMVMKMSRKQEPEETQSKSVSIICVLIELCYN